MSRAEELPSLSTSASSQQELSPGAAVGGGGTKSSSQDFPGLQLHFYRLHSLIIASAARYYRAKVRFGARENC